MLEIKSEWFYPLEDDKDLRVKIMPPSFMDAIDFMRLSKATFRQGEDGQPDPSTLNEEAMKEGMKELFRRCVTAVEGLHVDGKEVKDLEEFIKIAPGRVINPIFQRLCELISLAAEDEKKS